LAKKNDSKKKKKEGKRKSKSKDSGPHKRNMDKVGQRYCLSIIASFLKSKSFVVLTVVGSSGERKRKRFSLALHQHERENTMVLGFWVVYFHKSGTKGGAREQ